MANPSISLFSVLMLALLANIAFSDVQVEHCASQVSQEDNPTNKMSYIQHVSTKTQTYQATHVAWYAKGDAPVSIAIAKKTSNSPKSIIQYRFFDEVKGGEPDIIEEPLNDDEDLTFNGNNGPTSLFEVSSGDIYIVTENDKELKGTRIKPTDSIRDVYNQQTVTFSQFEFYNLVHTTNDGIIVFTSWYHRKNSTFHIMTTQLSGLSSDTYISGAVVSQDYVSVGFFSELLAFDIINRQYYKKDLSDQNSINLIKVESAQLSNYNLRPVTDSTLQYYYSNGIYKENYSMALLMLRGYTRSGIGMIFRTAIDAKNGIGFKDDAIPDLSTSSSSQEPQKFQGPHGQLIEIIPADKYCSLIMLAKKEGSDDSYVFSYLQGSVTPDNFPINQVLQITSNFRRVFIFTEKILYTLDVKPTQSENIEGYQFAVQKLILGENIRLTKTLQIERATRNMVKNQWPAYTVIVDKCFCSKIIYSDFACFQSDITCVVATSQQQSDCTDETAFADSEADTPN